MRGGNGVICEKKSLNTHCETVIVEGIRSEMWSDFYKMKSSFIYLNLSGFATVGNRNMMDLVFCPG